MSMSKDTLRPHRRPLDVRSNYRTKRQRCFRRSFSAHRTYRTLSINNLIGWRNYASAKPSGNLTSNFTFNATSATNFVSYVLGNSNGFLSTGGQTWTGGGGIGTDQAFITRQELISFKAVASAGISIVNALQYLTTFSRELNRPSWKPSTPTAINPDSSAVRVSTAFIRADGTQAVVGEPLLKPVLR